jgi:hypothetical protein
MGEWFSSVAIKCKPIYVKHISVMQAILGLQYLGLIAATRLRVNIAFFTMVQHEASLDGAKIVQLPKQQSATSAGPQLELALKPCE